jgi:serine/threonine protein kinase
MTTMTVMVLNTYYCSTAHVTGMHRLRHFHSCFAATCVQSHLSTRRYGTVTHMPPELLVSGKLTPAADIYSFGVMSESPLGCMLVRLHSSCTVAAVWSSTDHG